MRIVSGQKGRQRLRALPGGATRPTSARVREAIFNILWARGFSSGPVLDLYAGTGALGLEALSRGWQKGVFVDSGRAVTRLIEDNAKALEFSDRATIVCRGVLEYLAQASPQRFDCVFLDPPYAISDLDQVLTVLAKRHWVALEGVVVIEHAVKRNPPNSWDRFALLQRKKYGGTAVSFYVQNQGS